MFDCLLRFVSFYFLTEFGDCFHMLFMVRRLFPHAVHGTETVSTCCSWYADCFHMLFMVQRLFPHAVHGTETVSTCCSWYRDCFHMLFMVRRLFPHAVHGTQTVSTCCSWYRDCFHMLFMVQLCRQRITAVQNTVHPAATTAGLSPMPTARDSSQPSFCPHGLPSHLHGTDRLSQQNHAAGKPSMKLPRRRDLF